MNEEQLTYHSKRFLKAHPAVGRNVPSMVRLLRLCELRSLPRGRPLCSEGDPGDELFLLLYGDVKVLRRSASGESKELFTIDRPALLGHMSLVDGSPRSATCVADGPVELAVLNRERYLELIAARSRSGVMLRRLLLASLCRQLVVTTDRLTGLAARMDDTAPRVQPLDETMLVVKSVLDGWSQDDLADLQDMEVVAPSRRPMHKKRF